MTRLANRSIVVNDNTPSAAPPYLRVMARHAAGQRWHVFQLSDESPRITLADSVTSYDEVHELAEREQRPVHIADEAWRQMVADGVAPDTAPDDVTLV